MNFKTQIKEDIAILTVVASRLDASIAPELKKVVAGIVGDGTTRLVLDLEKVDFMDSSGLGAVISSFKLTGQKGEFVICNMSEAVAEIFSLTHMDRLFEIYPSVDEGYQKMCA